MLNLSEWLQRGDGGFVLADGGLETTLVFHEGIDLPCFAAFPLVLSGEGRAVLDRYYTPYLDLAAERGLGFILDTPTWRANPDWAARLGYDAAALDAANAKAVDYVAGLRDARGQQRDSIVLNGAIGPRGDGYVVGAAMTPAEAAAYHRGQIRVLAQSGAEMVSAVTMTYAEEAIGIAQAAAEIGIAAAISFTVETDGRLPSGEELGAAIERVDRESDGSPLYYMVNCAHPRHFDDALASDAGWLGRLRGIRANASTASHAELDAATELDRGDPLALGRDYAALRRRLPQLAVLGGCCGTDHSHIRAICEACG